MVMVANVVAAIASDVLMWWNIAELSAANVALEEDSYKTHDGLFMLLLLLLVLVLLVFVLLVLMKGSWHAGFIVVNRRFESMLALLLLLLLLLPPDPPLTRSPLELLVLGRRSGIVPTSEAEPP